MPDRFRVQRVDIPETTVSINLLDPLSVSNNASLCPPTTKAIQDQNSSQYTLNLATNGRNESHIIEEPDQPNNAEDYEAEIRHVHSDPCAYLDVEEPRGNNETHINGVRFSSANGVQPSESMSSLAKHGVTNRNIRRLMRHGSSMSEGDATENIPFTSSRHEQDQLYLFQEDLDEGMKVGTFLSQTCQTHRKPSTAQNTSANQKPSNKLGTLNGVFLPCLQNIFGVLVFIRLPWVIGSAGALEGLLIILLASATSLLCAFSMSAIATNGVMKHGGSYFLISRSLGPELGGAVGFMYAIGQSIATGMYVVAAVEICVTYMAPQLLIVDKINCYRIYGTVLLVLLGATAVIGLRLLNRFALFFLLCVITSIFAIIVGTFVNATGGNELRICLLGDRLIAKPQSVPCTKNTSSPLWSVFCKNESIYSCKEYFINAEMREEKAFPGLLDSRTFLNNSVSHNSEYRQYLSEGEEKVFADTTTPLYQPLGFVIADLSESFTVLLSIFFPAVTGIMAGSNRSGDLKNVQRSIPVGTLFAVLFTSSTYIILAFLYSGTVNSLLLRDKYGRSIGGGLVVAEVAWPHPMVVLVGAMMATIGAALQTMIGAPRLVLAIAKDGVLDFLTVFATVSRNGEPLRALLVVLVVAELAILAGSIDIIAPVLTQCTLLCYLFVNLACALQAIIRHPNWRPRFRFYHWSMSVVGACLAIAIMIISSWYYACIVIGLGCMVYKYIDFRGAEKEWGDGWSGLALSTARYSLLRLESHSLHTKNWRPQLLVFCRLDENMKPVHQQLFPLASQLKAGRGLTVFASILEGDFVQAHHKSNSAKEALKKRMETENVKGFAEVLVASDARTGMNHLIQTAGIGAMKHNTVVMCWPIRWRENTEYKQWRIFLDTLRTCHAASCAFLVPKNIAQFPGSAEKMRGSIDVWWIVHDGGLLMLLPFLLKQSKTWKKCKLRLFTIATLTDNTVQLKKDLESFLYGLRIEAEAHVVEMGDCDISAYTYERTLAMEQGRKFLKHFKEAKRSSFKSSVQVLFEGDTQQATQTKSVVSDGYLTEQSHAATEVQNADESFQTDEVHVDEKDGLGDLKDVRLRLTSETEKGISQRFGGSKPTDRNVRRMHTAVSLNQVIRTHSSDAQLVILNLPKPPKSVREVREMNYMEFVEELTSGLSRVLMVRGAGREVVTIYS